MKAIMGKSSLDFQILSIIFAIVISTASCQEEKLHEQQHQQELPQQNVHQPEVQHQQHQPHQSQPTRVTIGTQWNRRQRQRQQIHPTSSPSHNNNNDLFDRVSVLATLDQDQRNRLEALNQKIVQFESSNLARLDSLSVQQMDIVKRLESMEYLQKMTKRQVDKLLDSLESLTKTNENNDLIAQRHTRNIGHDSNTNEQNLDDSNKLDALSTFLVSIRTALNDLQVGLESNVTQLVQDTKQVNQRLNNLERRQQQQLRNQRHNQFYGYIPPPTGLSRPLITSCAQGAPTTDGILQLQLSENSEPFFVRCDEQVMNGGWTIIQDRYTGELNFQRDWNDYKVGFGNLADEYFIGLDKLHSLTTNAVHELVIVMEAFDGQQRTAKYDAFAIGNEAESYAITLLGPFSGTAGDSFTYHAGSKFSTFDNDNDGCVDCNCAQAHYGGWWYNWCEMSNLNGKYYKKNETVQRYTGMYWHHFTGPNASLKSTRMMIRPVSNEQEYRR